MTMTTVDLFVVLAIIYFCYLGKQLVEIIRNETNPQEPPVEQWFNEIRWKDD